MESKQKPTLDETDRDKARRAAEFISNALAQCRGHIGILWDVRSRPEAVVGDDWWIHQRSVMLHALYKARARCPGISVYLKPAIKNSLRFETRVGVLLERLVGEGARAFKPGPITTREAKRFQSLMDEIEETELVLNPALRALAASERTKASASTKRGLRARRKQPAASEDWIKVAEAVTRFSVSKSSLHDWTSKWGPATRRKNHKGHTELKVEALTSLLREKRILQGE